MENVTTQRREPSRERDNLFRNYNGRVWIVSNRKVRQRRETELERSTDRLEINPSVAFFFYYYYSAYIVFAYESCLQSSPDRPLQTVSVTASLFISIL